MAKLTTPAKALIAITIVGVAGASAWHLGVKDMVADMGNDTEEVQASNDATGTPTATGPAGTVASVGNPVPVNDGAALGSNKNPVTVSLVSFHGYAPAIVANGNSLTTKPGSIYANKGVNVNFVIQDNIPTLAEVFTSNTAHCAWRTSDFWAQEQPNLRNNNLDARAIMVVDNTQGADAIISRDPSIRSIEDLAGKQIALLQYTPSDGMVIDAIDNSSLSARKKKSVKFVYINVDEGTAGVRAAFESGSVDAAALWDPDLSLALKNTPNSHVVYSTKTATNLIFDVMVCNKKYLDDPANTQAFQNFVEGWMDAVTQAKANPDNAVAALTSTEQFFTLLAQQEGRGFVKSLFGNIVWTGIEDNVRILGLNGGSNHYERVYKRFDGIYRGAGALANPNSPVINPADSFDYRFIKTMFNKNKTVVAAAAAIPQFTFNKAERKQLATKPAALQKPVTVNFATGQSALTKRGQSIVDAEMVPLIENNGAAYFMVSGNTDKTGSRSLNMKLSKARAQAVVNYLVKEWEFPAARFQVVGNGPDQPLCDEANPASEGLSLKECRARNRTTRAAVFGR